MSTSTNKPTITKTAVVPGPDIAVIVPLVTVAVLAVSIVVGVVVSRCQKRGHCKCGEYASVPVNDNSTNNDTTGEFCNRIYIF